MGCGDSREKIEDEMIKLKFKRAQIQMERNKNIQKLEEIENRKIKTPVIPDYISVIPEKPLKKNNSDIKLKTVPQKKENEKKTKKTSPSRKKKEKNQKPKKSKNKKTESTKPSKKN